MGIQETFRAGARICAATIQNDRGHLIVRNDLPAPRYGGSEDFICCKNGAPKFKRAIIHDQRKVFRARTLNAGGYTARPKTPREFR